MQQGKPRRGRGTMVSQGDGPRQPQGGPSSKEEEGRGLSLEAEGFREKVGLAQQGERPWALGPLINFLKHSTNRS